MPLNNVQEIVKKYQEIGWVALPIPKGGVHPAGLTGWQTSTKKDADTLLSLFRDDSNVGILSGKESGIICLDIDIKKGKGGDKTLEGLIKTFGELPHTVMSRSPSGGTHYYFKYPKGGIINRLEIGRGIDVQADGSQTVEYPSTKENGNYEWINDPWSTPIVPLPEKWLELLTNKHIKITNSLDGNTLIKLLTHLPTSFTLPKVIPDGDRNTTIARYSFSLLGKNTPPEEIESLVFEANRTLCIPPMDDSEVKTIIESTRETHERHQRQVIPKDSGIEVTKEVEPTWKHQDDKGRVIIDDYAFAQWMKESFDLINVGGIITSKDGRINEAETLRIIMAIMAKHHTQGTLNQKARNYFGVLRGAIEPVLLEVDPYQLTLNDNSFRVENGEMIPFEPDYIPNRIHRDYKPEAKCPTWNKYLTELFYEEDIPTIQQFLGYCLLPNTRIQQALFIIGDGKEGKSRIRVTLEKILYSNQYTGKIFKLEERFATSNLVNKLVMFDDDVQMAKIEKTDTFKEIVTAEGTFAVERKGIQMTEEYLYCRIVGLGNEFPQTLWDKSEGWNRRILPIEVKPRPKDRVVDPQFQDKLNSELDGIFAWMIRGMLEISKRNFIIHESERTIRSRESLKKENNNVIEFLETTHHIEITTDINDYVKMRDLKQIYIQWCNNQDDKTPTKQLKKRILEYAKREGIKLISVNVREGKETYDSIKGMKLTD